MKKIETLLWQKNFIMLSSNCTKVLKGGGEQSGDVDSGIPGNEQEPPPWLEIDPK